jgi:hypothetical protein
MQKHVSTKHCCSPAVAQRRQPAAVHVKHSPHAVLFAITLCHLLLFLLLLLLQRQEPRQEGQWGALCRP